MWEAVVAGAGPAGAAAAYTLARSGCGVLFADAAAGDDHKVGEALPGAALRLLRSVDLPVPDVHGPHTPIGGNLSAWDSEELVAVDFIHDPDGAGWRLDRLRFDAALRRAAIHAGARFKAMRVSGIERGDAFWQVRFDDGKTATTRWLIDATGRRAGIARRLGAKRLRDAPLIGVYGFGEQCEGFRFNRTLIEAAPRGWWYAARLPSGAPVVGFHASPREAARLVTEPNAWRQALAETRHIGPILRDVTFNSPLRAMEACGARLGPYGADGWIACGDAALSFDPISGQGIFAALHGGISAGRTVLSVLADDPIGLSAYVDRLEQVRRVYLARCRSLYRSQSRWPNEPFWSCQREDMQPSYRGNVR